MKYGFLAVLLVFSGTALQAGPVTISFVGIGNGNEIGDYYNGGAGGNLGISFDGNPSAVALTQNNEGGTGNFGGGPFNAAMNINASSPAIMDVTGGFTSLSFWYSDPTVGSDVVQIFDQAGGGNGNGNIIASVVLPTTPFQDAGGPGDGDCTSYTNSNSGAIYCPFELVTITMSGVSGPAGTVDQVGGISQAGPTNGVGYSVDFGGDANFILYQGITIDACDQTQTNCPTAGAPEPSTWLLFGTGGILMLFGSRKLKLRKNQASS